MKIEVYMPYMLPQKITVSRLAFKRYKPLGHYSKQHSPCDIQHTDECWCDEEYQSIKENEIIGVEYEN